MHKETEEIPYILIVSDNFFYTILFSVFAMHYNCIVFKHISVAFSCN